MRAMLKTVPVLISLLLLMMSGTAWAQTDAATAETLLRKSGLWAQLAGIAQQVRAGMAGGAAEQGATLTDAEAARLDRAVDTAYAAPRLRVSVLRTLVREMPAMHVVSVLAWHDSAAGRVFTRMEEAASAADQDSDTMAQGAHRLAAMSEARRLLLERLMVESRAGEALAGMTINTALGVQQGLRSMRPDAPGPSADELRAVLQAQRPQLERAFGTMAVAAFAQVYAEASDEQLQAYLRFQETEAGRQFNRVMETAMDRMFLEAATELGRALPGTKDQANA